MGKKIARAVFVVAVLLAGYGLVVVPVVRALTMPATIVLTPSEYAQYAPAAGDSPVGNDTDAPKYITIKLFGFIPLKKVLVNVLPFDTILVGGIPVGLCGNIDGVLVTADSADGKLRVGDVIQAVDNVSVHDLPTFRAQCATQTSALLTIKRDQKILTRTVDLTQDLALRDTTKGMGMLTFINPEDHTFSALGHQMSDFETGAAVDLAGGEVYSVNVFGLEPTTGRQTGVLKSSIRQTTPQGSITQGTSYGVTGCLHADSNLLAQATTTMPVATRYQVRPGKATLRTSLDGVTVEEFACEILKTRYQNAKSDKSMVIRITDPRLLERTGGIIHGMSGSPIIQNGHIVGALTHAMTHDAAKGYAIYIDFVAI